MNIFPCNFSNFEIFITTIMSQASPLKNSILSVLAKVFKLKLKQSVENYFSCPLDYGLIWLQSLMGLIKNLQI